MEIEKNKPMPTPGKGRIKYPFRKMKIGESFFVETKNTTYDKNKAAATLYSCAKALNIEGFRISTRREKLGVRCWRIQ